MIDYWSHPYLFPWKIPWWYTLLWHLRIFKKEWDKISDECMDYEYRNFIPDPPLLSQDLKNLQSKKVGKLCTTSDEFYSAIAKREKIKREYKEMCKERNKYLQSLPENPPYEAISDWMERYKINQIESKGRQQAEDDMRKAQQEEYKKFLTKDGLD